MSSIAGNFDIQQEAARKKVKDMTEQEKITALKREIDNLRTEVHATRKEKAQQKKLQESRFCSSHLCRRQASMLSVLLLLGIASVFVMKRWRRRQAMIQSYHRAAQESSEYTVQFELHGPSPASASASLAANDYQI